MNERRVVTDEKRVQDQWDLVHEYFGDSYLSSGAFRRIVECLDASDVGVWWFDRESDRAWISPKACALLGVDPDAEPTPELVVNGIFSSGASPDGGPNNVAGPGRRLLEHRMVFGEAPTHWVSMDGRAGRALEEMLRKAESAAGSVIDIESRTQSIELLKESHDDLEDLVLERTGELRSAYNALVQSESKYRSLFACVPDAVVIVNPRTGRIVEVNEQTMKMLGQKYEQLVGVPFKLLVAGAPLHASTRPGDTEEGSQGLIVLQREDGSTFPAEVNEARFDMNGEDFEIRIIRDVSERQAATEQLRRFAAVLKMSTDAHIFWNLDRRVIGWNRGAELLYGYTEDEAVSMGAEDLVPPRAWAREQEYIERLFAGEPVEMLESQRRTKAGKIVHVSVVMTLVRDSKGEPIAIGSTARDLTERRLLEREIADLTASDLREIAQEIHDNVGQQMTGIRMLAENLYNELEKTNSKYAKAAQELAKHAHEAQRTVRLVSHGLMPVQVDEQGLRAALEKLAEGTQALFGVPCRFVCRDSVVTTDRFTSNHLYRIAQEAVHNAARHSGCSEIVVELLRKDADLVLEVRDDGDGLAGNRHHVGGMGLRILHYRASLIGATLAFTHNTPRGTVMRCTALAHYE